MAKRDLQHLLGRRHFEVERDRQPVLEPGDIVVADVAPVLAQMGGDAVGARFGGGEGGPRRIGMIASTRVADGGDMIDVSPETQMMIGPLGHAIEKLREMRKSILAAANIRRGSEPQHTGQCSPSTVAA